MNGTQPNLAPAERYDLGKHGRELILDARNVAVDFKVEGGVVNAVRDVSFQLHKGETIALVGESGSGKSVTARTIMRLLTKRATILPGTKITLAGRDIVSMKEDDMRKLRGNDVAMIFQEPMSSLNPVYTIGQQICEILHLHNKISRPDAMKRAEAASSARELHSRSVAATDRGGVSGGRGLSFLPRSREMAERAAQIT
jgi:peptide/nickel transport system ATP-binding protein